MRPANAWHLYRVRLRARWVQECLALVGIAAGVALLFASQVSNSSLQSSVGELTRGIAGNATLQLQARDPHGFPERMLARVRRIPGVRLAAPLLEAQANAIGPRGSESVELVGADESLSLLRGALVRHVELAPFAGIGALVLPAPLSRTLGVDKFGQEVTLQLAGHTVSAPLYTVLHESQIGPLVSTPVALAPLSYAQEMTGLTARVSRIFVQPAPGMGASVRAALTALAAGRLNVEPSDYDETLFAKAAAASNQSTALFAAISALVGFLFAFNAMLLTVPQRRRLIADLRRDGYTPRTVIAILLLDAVVLGVLACALGVALGEELSIHLFHTNPAFLSLAFAVGTQRVVTWQSVALAGAGGMLAAIVAVLSPLRDILSRDPLAAIGAREGGGVTGGRTRKEGGRAGGGGGRAGGGGGRAGGGGGRAGGGGGRAGGRGGRAGGGDGHARDGGGQAPSGAGSALASLAALAGATAVLLAAPTHAIAGMVLLLAALLLVLPLALSIALALVRRLAAMRVGVVGHVAAMELRAARSRAVAIAATGAIAVFGSVAIQGAHGDLLAGLDRAAHDTNAFTNIWVAPAGAYNLLKTTPFAPTPQQQARLARLPGVRAVLPYRSGLLDWGTRRVLVVAPARSATPLLPADQLLQGNLAQATARVRGSGWLVLSQALAEEHHLRIGQAFTLPSPDPQSFRVAALSTNLGWAPGAIAMNAADYARAWGSNDVSALNVLLAPGLSATRAAREVEGTLRTGSTAGSSAPGSTGGSASGSISGFSAPGSTGGSASGSISGFSAPGSTGGSASGSISGSSAPGSTAGSASGSTGGAAPGSTAGSAPGSTAGSAPGSTSGSSAPGSTGGSASGSTSGSASGPLGAPTASASGLAVQTAAQQESQQRALSRVALARLTQIATLIPIVAVLAMAAAMGAMIWQRRPRLAKLKLEGIARAELWRTILLESLLLVGVGCLTGAVFGIYGQQLADRALAHVVNFPVVYSLTGLAALSSLALVTATALAIMALPGYLAARVPAALALQD